MSEFPPVCSELRQRVEKAEANILAIKTKIQDLQNQIPQYKTPSKPSPFAGKLEVLRMELERAEKFLAFRKNELAEAEREFRKSGFEACLKPNTCTGDKLANKMWNLLIPEQITDTTDLEHRVTELTNEINELRLSRIKCLYADPDGELNDTNRLPPFDFSIVVWNNHLEVIKLVEAAMKNKCVSPTVEQQMIKVLRNPESYEKIARRGFPLKQSAAKKLNKFNLDEITRLQDELALFLEDKHPKQIELAKLNEEIEDKQNPESTTNSDLRKKILSNLAKMADQCMLEKKVKYTSSTVLTATAGPGAPEGINFVTKTLNNHGCIIFNQKTGLFSLDPTQAVAELGPGGCDTNERIITENLSTGPYWLYPVNITSTITVENIDELITCVMDRFQANITSTNSREPVGGSTGGRWPTLTGNSPITLTHCVTAPK